MGDEAARQGRGDGRASRGGNEVLHRQSRHLAEVRHGAFTAVRLPVGVGHEAHGGVERQVLGHAGKALAVQRQDALQPDDRVDEDEADRIEGQ